MRQLLKMVASGDLSPAEFKQLTKHVIGYDEEVPIDMTGDDTLAAETEASAQRMRAAPSPAAAAHTPTATEAGIGKDGACGPALGHAETVAPVSRQGAGSLKKSRLSWIDGFFYPTSLYYPGIPWTMRDGGR